MATKEQEESETVTVRLAKYQRRLRLQGLIAAGLLAEVTVYSAVKFSERAGGGSQASSVLGALFLTTIVAAGLLLAMGRGAIEWQADLLTRSLSNEAGGTASSPAPLGPDSTMKAAEASVQGLTRNWPIRERGSHLLLLLAALLAGGLLVRGKP